MTELTAEVLADALEAAARVLRGAGRDAAAPEAADIDSAVALARELHPALGGRQAMVIELLDAAEPTGTTTGALSRTMDYDQPNVYLTLRGLITLGFAEKDASTDPHTYRLGEKLRRAT